MPRILLPVATPWDSKRVRISDSWVLSGMLRMKRVASGVRCDVVREDWGVADAVDGAADADGVVGVTAEAAIGSLAGWLWGGAFTDES